jgi:pseudaminic acid cytidylyltransferase
MNIAIIPARIGSKRIFQKNIRLFHGKPIILHTLNKVIKSKIFDEIIVSSDSKKIFDIVNNKKILFHKRNAKTSNDRASTISAINSCIDYFNFNSEDNICCIYPCSVFLKKDDLKKMLSILKKNPNNFITPVLKYTHPIQRSFKLSSKNKVLLNNKNNTLNITQKFQSNFHDAGQFYWAKKKIWSKSVNILQNSLAFKLSVWRAVDIDDDETWKKAEILYNKIK